MEIFNKNTKLAFLDTSSSISDTGNTEEYFQDARLKFLLLFYLLCASYGKKSTRKYKYSPERDIMFVNIFL